MKNSTYVILALLATVATIATAPAQTLVLEDFGDGGSTSGTVIAGTSWVGQTSLTGTALSVGGTALSDSGWHAYNLSLPDLSAYSYVSLSLQLSPDNAATNIFVTFDDGSDVQTVTFLASSFTTSSVTTVSIPITWSISTTTVESWNIGGGATPPGNGSPAFRMTFDNLALNATAPIPEPSTYAALLGLVTLGVVCYRRRQTKQA